MREGLAILVDSPAFPIGADVAPQEVGGGITEVVDLMTPRSNCAESFGVVGVSPAGSKVDAPFHLFLLRCAVPVDLLTVAPVLGALSYFPRNDEFVFIGNPRCLVEDVVYFGKTRRIVSVMSFGGENN
jgi:hypothetical protein